MDCLSKALIRLIITPVKKERQTLIKEIHRMVEELLLSDRLSESAKLLFIGEALDIVKEGEKGSRQDESQDRCPEKA